MLILFNKPYGVLCQFTDKSVPPRRTLAEFIKVPDVYPAGRLDYDSEGLLVLTDDGALAHRMTDPKHKIAKTYLAQVEGVPDAAAIERLRRGVVLNDGPTLPAEVDLLDAAPSWLWPRDPPIRFRKSVPDAWMRLTLREGRNRQVRNMCEAIGHPVDHLKRVAIGPLRDPRLKTGYWRDLDDDEVKRLKKAAAGTEDTKENKGHQEKATRRKP